MWRSFSCFAQGSGLLGCEAADEGGTVFRNVANQSHNCTESYPSRLDSSSNTYLNLRIRVLVDNHSV